MNVNKYRESVIQLYSNTLTKYFEYNLKNHIKKPYNGWKVILKHMRSLMNIHIMYQDHGKLKKQHLVN